MNISTRTPLIIFASLFYSLSIANMSFAQELLDVSGIVFGGQSVAIVDGVTVKKGDHIHGFTVDEIGKNFVRFISGTGTSVVKKLGDKTGSSDQPLSVVPPPVASAVVVQPSVPVVEIQASIPAVASKLPPQQTSSKTDRDLAIKRHLTAAVDYVSAAERMMSSQKVINIKACQQALGLYVKAERELQFALQRTSIDMDVRKTIRSAMAAVREESRVVSVNAKVLEDKIKSATEHHTVVVGMTQSQVMKNMGKPSKVKINKDSDSIEEQWIYIDRSGKSINFYFSDEILTLLQR